MNCESAALAIGGVGRSAVQSLTVVQSDSAGRQVTNHGLVVVDHFAHVEKNVAALGLVVDHGTQVRAWDELHCAIVQVDVVKREPAADQVRGKAPPVGVVLVPEDRSPVMRRFVKPLVVEQLNVGSDYIFDDVEYALMVGELVKLDVVLGNLHELEHLLLPIFIVVMIIFEDGQVSNRPFPAAPEREFFVVLFAHFLDKIVFEHFADNQETVFPEAGYLRLGQRLEAVFANGCFG